MGEKRFRWGCYVLAALVLLWTLVACGSFQDGYPGGEPSLEAGSPRLEGLLPQARQDEVLIRFVGPAQYQADFEMLAERFHSQGTGIRVEVLSISQVLDGREGISGFSDIVRALAESADVLLFQMDSSLPDSGLLLDLSPWVHGSPEMDWADYFPRVLDLARARGGQWALPAYSLFYPLYYDQEVLTRTGVPFPDVNWSPAEFLALAQRLTEVKEGAVVRYGFVDYGGTARTAWIPGLDSAPDEEQDGWPGGRMTDAIAWYVALAQQHGVMPAAGSGEAGIQRDWDLILSQRAALWSDALANFSYHQQLRSVGIAPIPTWDGLAKMPAIVNGYMISAGTRWPKESWSWIRFLDSQFVSFATTSDGSPAPVPARRSVAEATDYWDQYRPDVGRVLRFAAEHLAVMSTGSRKSDLVNEAVKAALVDGAPGAAVADARLAWEAYRSQMSQVTPTPVSMVPLLAGPSERRGIVFAPPPGSDVAAYRQVAQQFNQSQEAPQIEIVPPAQSHRADCFVDLRPVDAWGDQEGILNLGPLLGSDDDVGLDDFHGQLLVAFRDQGDLWGLPLQAKAYVLFYNPQLFQDAGLPYPQAGWTTDEFLAYAQALTAGQGAQKRYGFLSLAGDGTGLEVFLALRGAWPWDEEGRPRFDAPEVVEGVRWYTNLAVQHGVSPAFPQDLLTSDPRAQTMRLALVREGRVAMWGDFVGVDRGEAWPGDTGAVPPPQGEQLVTEFLPDGFFIRAGTPYAQGCWTWFKALVRQPTLIRGLPGWRDLGPTMGGEGNLATPIAGLESYADLPQLAERQLVNQRAVLHQAVARIYQGVSPATALARAQEQLMGGNHEFD